jgi:MscS family membrane protein
MRREISSLNCRSSASGNYALVVATGFFIWAGSTAHVEAQVKKSPPRQAKAERAPATDPLGRETPRSAMMGFLKSEANGDYTAAALYLQAPAGGRANLEQQVKQFRALRPNFKGDVAFLSNDPNGDIEPGLPPGEVRAGMFQVGARSSDVILVRVDDPTAGQIWLISRETVTGAGLLFEAKERENPTLLTRFLPAVLTGTEVLGMSLAAWFGWLLSFPISMLLARPVGLLLTLPILLVRAIRKRRLRTVWETPLGKPIRCIIAILINSLGIYLLKPPLLYRVYYLRLMAALLAVCLTWLLAGIIDLGFERALNRARTQRTGAESILILTQRSLRIVLALVAIVAALSVAGFNMRTELAGLGIGGLVIALAAQKTLENTLSGISLLMDKAVQVGDVCRIGEHTGVVEDVGLRSVKLRTRDQALLVVPNGALAQMQFGNLASRQKCLIDQHFSLRIETKIEELHFVLDQVQAALDQHTAIEPGTSRVRLANFAGAAFDLELWAYARTRDSEKFTEIQQDVILKVAEIVAASGARFAAPTRLTYLTRDAVADGKRAGRRVTELESPRTENLRLDPDAVPNPENLPPLRH